jgi:hypothetical protein
MSQLNRPQTNILAPLSKKDEEQGVAQAMAPVGTTLALNAHAEGGSLLQMLGRRRQQRMLREFETKKLEVMIKEALLIETNRIALMGGHQRLVDHLYIGERQSELAPRIADHFAQLQSNIQKVIHRRLMDDAVNIQMQRAEWSQKFAAGEINALVNERQMKLLDETETAMVDNLQGLLARLTEKAAADLLLALTRLGADHHP